LGIPRRITQAERYYRSGRRTSARCPSEANLRREETLPKARELPGWKGVIGLADRSSGRVKLITLSESADALRATEERADQLRKQTADRGGQRVTGVNRYEVALADRLSEVTV
jgi:hypothetical protein